MNAFLLIVMALLLIAALERTNRRQGPHRPGLHGSLDHNDRDWARTKLDLLALGGQTEPFTRNPIARKRSGQMPPLSRGARSNQPSPGGTPTPATVLPRPERLTGRPLCSDDQAGSIGLGRLGARRLCGVLRLMAVVQENGHGGSDGGVRARRHGVDGRRRGSGH